jgi:hypothetical protein
MRYGIMINMAYEYHSHESAIAPFERAAEWFSSGWSCLYSCPGCWGGNQSCARLVLDELDAQQAVSGHSIFNYIRGFYGFDLGNIKNLLLPEPDVVAVEKYHNEPVFDEVDRQAC